MHERLAALASQIGWNQRVFAEPDLLELCEQEGIRVITYPQPLTACYLHMPGLRIIGLSSRLQGNARTVVLAHELGHHFLHTPRMWFNWGGNHCKKHHQARVFAACALIPGRQVDTVPPADLVDLHRHPPDLVEFRLEVRLRYGY